MSVNGYFNTTTVGNFYFTFEWSRTGYNSTRNEHYISYTLKAHNSTGSYRTVYLKNLIVNGVQVYYNTSGIQYKDGDVITSSNATIPSSNSSGDGSFNASFEAGVGTTSGSNCSGSGSWNLDRIPRYANITSFSVSQIDETSVQYNWNADAYCDLAWYSIDNGTTWYDKPANNIITGLSSNTTYNFKLRVRRADSGLTTDSGTYTQSTYDYPKPISATDFMIGNGANVNLYNPLGRNVTLQLISNNDGSVIGTYTGTYNGVVNGEFKTSDAINRQYASIPNTKSSTYFARVTYNGVIREFGNPTYFINENESRPIFSNFDYEDINATTLALTKDSSVLIAGYSTNQITISTSNKATTQKHAGSIVNYKAVQGTKNTTENEVANTDVTLELNNVDSNIINVYATDSRGNSSDAVTKTLDIGTKYIQYIEPTIQSAIIERGNSGVGEEVTLTFNGTFWNNSFSNNANAVTNDVTATYEYKEASSSTWLTGATTLTLTKNNDTYSFSADIRGDLTTGFTISKAFNIRLIVTDELSSKSTILTLGSGTPAIAINSNNGVAIGQKYDTNLGGALQVNGTIYSKTNSIVGIIPKMATLYKSNSPNTATITLNDNITNYDYIEVIGVGADDGRISSGKICVKNNMLINIVGTSFRDNQATLAFWVTTLLANNNTLTPQTSKWLYITPSTPAYGFGDGNYMGVLEVIGYKL